MNHSTLIAVEWFSFHPI